MAKKISIFALKNYKMKHIYIIMCLLLVGCTESRKSKPSIVDDDGMEEIYDREKADSVSGEILQKTKEEVETEKNNQSLSISRSSGSYSSSSRDDEPEYDNMRGFDPVSEDDMPDNGMSRYMENNDEEGWD